MTAQTSIVQQLAENQQTLFKGIEADIAAAAPGGRIPGKDFLLFARTAKREEDGEPSYVAVHHLVTLMVKEGVGFERPGTPKTLFSHLTTYDKNLYVDNLLTYVRLCLLSDTDAQSVSDLFNITEERLVARRRYGSRSITGKRVTNFLNEQFDVVKEVEALIREHQPKNAGEFHRDMLYKIEADASKVQEHFRLLAQEDLHSDFIQSLNWYALKLRMTPANVSWFINSMPVRQQHKKLWKDADRLKELSLDDFKQVLTQATLGSADHFAWGVFLNQFRRAGATSADMEAALMKVGAFRVKKDGSISHKLNPLKMSQVVHGLVYSNDSMMRVASLEEPDDIQLSQYTYFTDKWWRQYPELVAKYRLSEHLSLTPLFLLGEMNFERLFRHPVAELETLQQNASARRYQRVAIDRYALFCHLLDTGADRRHLDEEKEHILELPREWAYNMLVSKKLADQDKQITDSKDARWAFKTLALADAITYSKHLRYQQESR